MDNLISVVRSVLAMTPARCVALTDNLPDELVTRKPAPGEWSAAECIQHLLDTEHIFPSRIRSFLAGKDFAAFDPDRQGSPAGQRTPSEIHMNMRVYAWKRSNYWIPLPRLTYHAG